VLPCQNTSLTTPLAGISFSHHSHPYATPLRKPIRLAIRLLIALILILLPLASSLTSLSLIATTTSLIVLVLIVDLYGSSDKKEGFWVSKSKCRYETECTLRKTDMERMREGAMGIEELSRRDVGAGGGGVVDMS